LLGLLFNKQLLTGFLLLAIVITIIYVAITVSLNNPNVIALEDVEIGEYEGKDLSSINDFYENSIKGHQYIDNETYTLTITGLVNNDLELSYDDVIGDKPHYEKVVTLHCSEGWSVTIL
jgi:DMSO/TMAO reductase YedYZ molybdopterin-dependent catalytic subunit